MRYLLDSNVLIRFLKGDAASIQLLVDLTGLSSGQFAVSCVTQMEVWEGLYAAPNQRVVEQQFQALFDEVTLLPFDRALAKRAARLRQTSRRAAFARALDLLIAATALHHGLEQVSYDRQDYVDIPGLALYQG